jgi:hypothetical protein
MSLLEGRRWSGGSARPVSLNNDDMVIVQDAMASYADRGRLFATTHQGTGIVTQAGLSATDAILTIHNPNGSGVTGRLWFSSVGAKVANAAAAVFWLAVNTNVNAAIPTGTAAVVRNLKLGGGMTNNQGQTLEALTTVTLPAAPVAISTLGIGLTGAITTVPGIAMFERQWFGALLIQPGTTLSFQTSTASGAASCHAEFIWSEEPLVS